MIIVIYGFLWQAIVKTALRTEKQAAACQKIAYFCINFQI